ncbi:DUF547 domain-containing protein [Hyphobacterium sp. CCMP332]|nr:DUF547 domain-containing protein [Hyphobacterium sp. CCMP332]
MIRLGLIILIVANSIMPIIGQDFFGESDIFLKKYVKEGKVAYSEIQQDSKVLDRLINFIATYSLEQVPEREQKAFYINAYNILVIKGIVDNYPIQSPLDKEGFFEKVKYKVAGEALTLNEIENIKLRKEYNDPRIHFVLVCAAVSCPELISSVYHPESLEKQIESSTIKSLNDPEFVRVSDTKIAISEIFKWYAEDFGGQSNYIKFINKYRKNILPTNIALSFYEYDWTLNEKK